MNFREYFESRPLKNNTSGDFIKAALADTSFPANPGSWPEVKHYMETKGFDKEMLKAGHRVFKSFRDLKTRKKNAH